MSSVLRCPRHHPTGAAVAAMAVAATPASSPNVDMVIAHSENAGAPSGSISSYVSRTTTERPLKWCLVEAMLRFTGSTPLPLHRGAAKAILVGPHAVARRAGFPGAERVNIFPATTPSPDRTLPALVARSVPTTRPSYGDDPLCFTLHAASMSVSFRKRYGLTTHAQTLRFKHAGTHV
ncbi:hypothetical protein FA95DRAFT_1577845 [Auriscalpium vulgare]|uniref:Uncharacterized protein n=1 Tax=Auriscalpium vulgare TaxID=40419 RepID=A0ACB8R5L7_9AGAM|nr:hypothetical protein FA95DRAFT_1577845 [Auriscalpium vulgare]